MINLLSVLLKVPFCLLRICLYMNIGINTFYGQFCYLRRDKSLFTVKVKRRAGFEMKPESFWIKKCWDCKSFMSQTSFEPFSISASPNQPTWFLKIQIIPQSNPKCECLTLTRSMWDYKRIYVNKMYKIKQN